MRLARLPALDAICGEYLIGTLRGGARRRFERALREEPLVAQQLRHLQNRYLPRYAQAIEARPSAQVWKRLERTLGLSRYRAPWYRRAGFWRGWAVAATAALVLAIGLQPLRREPPVFLIAEMSGKSAVVSAHLSRDGRTMVLHSDRPVIAGPAQSYELWLLTPDGAALSLAVLGTLDTKLEVPEGHRRRLREGGRLAVTVEPPGGAPGGKATGPVIVLGTIKM